MQAILKSFQFKEVINKSVDYKTINILGTNETGENIILLIRKKPFPDSFDVATISKLDQFFNNDIFYKGHVEFSDEIMNRIELEIIYPAKEKDIIKYSLQQFSIIEETYDLYINRVKPIIFSE